MDITNLHLETTVGQDRRVVIELPPEFPLGPIILDIHAVVDQPAESQPATKPLLTREEARQRLLAAGRLVTTKYAPASAVHSSPEESERLAAIFSDKEHSTIELIDWERGAKE